MSGIHTDLNIPSVSVIQIPSSSPNTAALSGHPTDMTPPSPIARGIGHIGGLGDIGGIGGLIPLIQPSWDSRIPLVRDIVIRDQIILDDSFTKFFNRVQPGETLTIVARNVTLPDRRDLNLQGRKLVIITSNFNGLGGAIVNSGSNGNAGARGQNGPESFEGSGEPGDAGANGLPGQAGGRVEICARTIKGLRVIAAGGSGGAGGAGGWGGAGTPIFVDDDVIPIGTHPRGPPRRHDYGANGGNGGNGGAGAQGGHVEISSVSYSSQPSVDVSGGAGGAQGQGGRSGRQEGAANPRTRYASDGTPGSNGYDGISLVSTLSDVEYWKAVVHRLSSTNASYWARYRLAVGQFYLRRYRPKYTSRSVDFDTAMDEFQAVQSLSPQLDDVFLAKKLTEESARYLEFMRNGFNVLGMRRDLDLKPHFDNFMERFTSMGGLVLGCLDIGATELIHASNLTALSEVFTLQAEEVHNHVADSTNRLSIEQVVKENLTDDINECDSKIQATNREIQAALAEMRNHHMSFGQIVGLVSEVATAVIAVATAVPTGGTSLIAAVPAAMALARSVTTQFTPLAQAIFSDGSEEVLNKVKEEYAALKQDVTEVASATKSVINMVSVIRTIAASTTADNSKYVKLVQRAAELTHEYLLLKRGIRMSDMAAGAIQDSIDRAEDLRVQNKNLKGRRLLDASVIRLAGLGMIDNAHRKIDILMAMLFRAARSIEIYTLRLTDVELDVGHIHPDIELDYRELFISDTQLLALYSESWSRLLQPIDLSEAYTTYIMAHNPSVDAHTMFFTDPAVLQKFRESSTLPFNIEPSDLRALRYETKALKVEVSFIGAKSLRVIVSSTIEHGGRYTQLRRDGSRSDMLLSPLATQVSATLTAVASVPVTVGNDGTSHPTDLSFWGRGICGRYDLTVDAEEISRYNVDWTALREIQVWVWYQYLEH